MNWESCSSTIWSFFTIISFDTAHLCIYSEFWNASVVALGRCESNSTIVPEMVKELHVCLAMSRKAKDSQIVEVSHPDHPGSIEVRSTSTGWMSQTIPPKHQKGKVTWIHVHQTDQKTGVQHWQTFDDARRKPRLAGHNCKAGKLVVSNQLGLIQHRSALPKQSTKWTGEYHDGLLRKPETTNHFVALYLSTSVSTP